MTHWLGLIASARTNPLYAIPLVRLRVTGTQSRAKQLSENEIIRLRSCKVTLPLDRRHNDGTLPAAIDLKFYGWRRRAVTPRFFAPYFRRFDSKICPRNAGSSAATQSTLIRADGFVGLAAHGY